MTASSPPFLSPRALSDVVPLPVPINVGSHGFFAPSGPPEGSRVTFLHGAFTSLSPKQDSCQEGAKGSHRSEERRHDTKACRRGEECGSSEECRSDTACRRVGVDTLTLRLLESEARAAFEQLSKAAYLDLKRKLRAGGVFLRRYGCPYGSLTGDGRHREVIFRLSAATSANLLTHGRRHNSFVAWRAQMRQIARFVRQACACVGVHLDPLQLQILRLDLFVDALLCGAGGGYFDMLRLVSRSARLKGGLAYDNGIIGFGKSYAWACYGKGAHLLKRARKRGCLEALLEERSKEDWEQLFRLEVRFKSADAVRRLFKNTTVQDAEEEDAEEEGTPKETEPDEEQGEEATARVRLGELLERWEELPARFVATARDRCLKTSGAELEEGVAAARQRAADPPRRSQLPSCPVAWFKRKLHLTDHRMELGLDWTVLDNLPAYNAKAPHGSSARGEQNWLKQSPLSQLRQHLKVKGMASGMVSEKCARYQEALFEREVCRGNDILERYLEMEKAFLFDVQSAKAEDVDELRGDRQDAETAVERAEQKRARHRRAGRPPLRATVQASSWPRKGTRAARGVALEMSWRKAKRVGRRPWMSRRPSPAWSCPSHASCSRVHLAVPH